jgi:vacuolar-type H+-ATPase subunit H
MSSSEEPAAETRTSAPASDHAGVGAGVNAILEAAEQAAEEIRAAARKQGQDLMRQAEEAVAARIQELTREGDKIREEASTEARDIRLAVEAYGKSRRREADELVAKKVDDTERRAREILGEAEQRARTFEQQLQARHEQLDREVRDLEARRERVLRGLQELAAHIGEAIRQPAIRSVPEPPPIEANGGEPEIDEALTVRETRRESARRRLAR